MINSQYSPLRQIFSVQSDPFNRSSPVRLTDPDPFPEVDEDVANQFSGMAKSVRRRRRHVPRRFFRKGSRLFAPWSPAYRLHNPAFFPPHHRISLFASGGAEVAFLP